MNNVGEKYLPVGTVVMLKGGSKRVMITGFCTTDVENPNMMYDYAGCLYPEGFLSSEQTALFNHDQIVQVYHVGLIDEEEKAFKSQLKQIVAKMSMPMAPSPSPAGPTNTVNSQPEKAAVPAYTFSQNGEEVSATPATSVTNNTSASSFKFDENGVVVSS